HDEIIGQNPRILKSEEIPSEGYKELWETITAGGEWRGVFHNRKKNGQLCWESAIISPIRNREGRITSYLAIEEDITERKMTEEALKESEAKFRTFFEKNSSVMLLIDPDSGKIMAGNESAVSYYGYPHEQLIGMLISDINTMPAEKNAEERQRVLREECSYFIFQHRLANGELRDVEVYSTPIPSDGGTLLFSIIHDVTDRKRAEDNLIKAKSAADIANRAKSDFLATISHEIRTPLNGIMGMTELLMEKRLSNKKQFYVEMIQKSGDSLLRVINDVLDFSKIEAGEILLEEDVIDLQATRKEFRDLFGELAKKKGLAFRTRVARQVPLHVKGDRHRIHQILINLLGNAIKFTKSGEINFRISARLKNGVTWISFMVADTGIGINAAALNTLFQPFTQADTSTTRKYGGTGLGLTICKKLADLMQGQITVESEEGKGSRFILTLPMETAEAIPKPPPETVSKDKTALLKGRYMLVVEDNIVNQRLFQIMLENMSIKVRVANNGIEALEALAQERFDMVLMDCHMPEMDGLEAIQIFRKSELDKNLAHTPFIAVTANVMQGEKELCLKVGFDSFISKPVNKQELSTVLEQFIQDEQHEVQKMSIPA
ncbi:MAG: PAS domain S-box protein, partial [Magnetococcales bacterium]|nr:PAS domain S-box protein [Magnetococcales bacterium]